MDELQFRREAYKNPDNNDSEFLSTTDKNVDHINIAKANKLKYSDQQIEHLDQQIEQALKVKLPNDLEAKLLLNQQLYRYRHQRHKAGKTLALIISLMLFTGIIFTVHKLTPVDLSQEALMQLYQGKLAMQSEQDIGYDTINHQLHSLEILIDSKFVEQPGKILYSSFYNFHGTKSIHLVIQGEHGKVTLFIVPAKKNMILEKNFADNTYQGIGFLADNAYMLLVSKNKADLVHLKDEIKHAFI